MGYIIYSSNQKLQRLNVVIKLKTPLADFRQYNINSGNARRKPKAGAFGIRYIQSLVSVSGKLHSVFTRRDLQSEFQKPLKWKLNLY